jgi:dTDP-4-amino-4,6-dideoxygalactose transaminase
VQDGQRDAMVDHLKEKGVGSGIYYPVPIHQQTFYVNELGYDMQLPEAEQAAEEVISVPVHPALTQSELEAIVHAVNSFPGA